MPKKSSVLFRLALQSFTVLFVTANFHLSSAQTAPEYASITDVRTNGTGCPDGHAIVSLSPDYKDLSLLFDNYFADVGIGSSTPLSKLDSIKDCHVQIQMQIPEGWQMAFRAVDYRGFVALSPQGTAFQRFSILQQGAPIVSMKEINLKGPMNKDYYQRSEVRPERLTWSPCLSGLTSVQLMSQIGVRLNPRTLDRQFNQITLDSADTSLQQKLIVEWKKCSVNRPAKPAPVITPPWLPRDPKDSQEPREPVRPPRYRGR